MNEVTEAYNIPLEAVVGGPETMYPEYRKKLKDKYVMPPPCKEGCGRPPAPPALEDAAGLRPPAPLRRPPPLHPLAAARQRLRASRCDSQGGSSLA
jgi:hypothetical protein